MNEENGTPPVVVLLESKNERLWINLNTQYWFGASTIHKFLNPNIIWKESPNRTRQKTRCWWLKAPSLKHWKLHSWIEFFYWKKEEKKSCAQRYHVPSILPSVDFCECAMHNCDCNWLILFKRSDLMVECNFIAQNHSI